MIYIDGSYGEGGGQILRTSLALSLVTGKPFRIENIRANRKKSGLMRQHLTALNAAAEIGRAKVGGNTIGSRSFKFEPCTIKSGAFHFAVGSAGSCTLVLQTLLPALAISQTPSEIILEGGTHNPFAPPFDFLEKAFLPILNRMGAGVTAILDRPGFYPAGGGRFKAAINPTKRLTRIDLLDRGRIIRKTACAAVSNLPIDIAHRELKVVGKKMQWEEDSLKVINIENGRGPGNILTITIEGRNITEVFTGFGEKGVPAEKVAERTVGQVKEYLAFDIPVGRHLADQLLIPMAMAGGGRFRTLSPTKHTTTNMEIIKKFLDVDININKQEENVYEIEVVKRS